MSYKYFLIILILFSASHAKEFSSAFYLKAFLDGLDKDEIVGELRSVVEVEGQSRLIGSPGHQAIREHLLNKLKSLKRGEIIIHDFKPDIKWAMDELDKDFQKAVASYYKPESEEFQGYKKLQDVKKDV